MRLEDELKSRFRNDYQKARLNVYVTSAYLSVQMMEFMKKHKTSPAQYNILRILRGQESKQLCIGEIKSRMLDKNSDVSRIVDRLVAKSLVERKERKDDRRQKDIKITSKGLSLLSEMDGEEVAMDSKLHTLTENEVKTLNELLDKIRSTE